MLSREKQGFSYAGGFLEPIAPLSLPCGASLMILVGRFGAKGPTWPSTRTGVCAHEDAELTP